MFSLKKLLILFWNGYYADGPGRLLRIGLGVLQLKILLEIHRN
jgi:hypothetical protein